MTTTATDELRTMTRIVKALDCPRHRRADPRRRDRGVLMDLDAVMINDRHTEPTVYVYSTRELAIAAAREYAEAAVHGSCTVDEQVPPDGWLYHAVYCVEGDDVWVVPATLDGEVAT